EVLKRLSVEGLNDCYRHLPLSTEQIIHPDRWAAHDRPIKIEIADLRPVLGRDWKRADSDVNGEFGYIVLLGQFIGKQQARQAAEGWGGDRYALYEKESGEFILAQFTTWDTAKDAEEFFNAYRDRTIKRYKPATSFSGTAGSFVADTGEGLALI